MLFEGKYCSVLVNQLLRLLCKNESPINFYLKYTYPGGVWMSSLGGHVSLDLKFVSSSSILGLEISFKKKLKK